MRVSLGAGRIAIAVLATAFTLGMSGPAFAGGGGTYNNANIDIHGGNAAAFGGCVNYAKISARANRTPQSNACKNFAHADGGTVSLTGVSIFVDQEGGGGRRTHNNVQINISGGDATAVAGCVNYLQGTASASQKNECKNSADAHGGNVDLNGVDITVIQLG